MNLENVPGLPDHPHFPLLIQVLDEAGWTVAVSNIDQIYPLLPVMRARWMATCVSKLFQCDPKHVLVAKRIQLPEIVPGVGHDNNMSKFGCMMKELQPWELQQCLPSDDAMEAMSNPDYLPLKHRTFNSKNLKPEEVVQLRITTGFRPLPNVMALQGSQHLLPHDLLLEKGLHAYLLNDGTNLRFITPIEISTAMGFPHNVVLPSEFTAAWKMVGNSLAVPHAALQCLRAHYVLGNQSVFENGVKGPMELCDLVFTTRFSISGFSTIVEDDWMTLQMIPAKQPIPDSVPETVLVSDEDCDSHNPKVVSQDPYLADDSPPAKRICVSPTWKAEAEDLTIVPELSKADFPNCATWTVGTKQPSIGGLDFDTIAIQRPSIEQAYVSVRLLHSQGIWARSDMLQGSPSVSQAIRHFLPHAVQEQIQLIHLNQFPVLFGTIPNDCPTMNIVVKPFCFLRMVKAPWLKHDLPVQVDLTWTFADVISFVACEAAILSASVQIVANGKVMQPRDFVLQNSEVVFQAVIVACGANSLIETKTELHDHAETLKCPPPGTSDVALPAHQGLVRFTTRHPKWGTVRSVTVPTTSTANEAICLLLPGFEQSNPRFCVNEEVMDSHRNIGSFPEGNLDIWFDCQKPWPLVQVVRTTPFKKHGTPIHVCAKDVKGPFDFKAKCCKVPLDWTILDLVASFLELHASALTLLVLQQGKSIDPRTFVQQVGPETIDIRVCALPGGAKNNIEALTKKLAEILFKRGVLNEDKDSRASMILSKISHSEVAAILTKNEFDAWSELKKKANEHKIRMITSNELKVFQKEQRTEKGGPSKPASSSGPAKRPKKAGPADVDPDQVTIDLSHFTCGSDRPLPLKVAQWGPDSKGIAIATPAEAKKLLPISNLSADGLALLVLTDRTFDGKMPFTMPATNSQGHPMLASGVLLNYGDVEIKYEPTLSGASLNEVPTATLEVVIQKKLVPKWNDVQNPLNYLGLQLPEIRSDKVIQSWNFRAYNDERVRVKHENATYIHGFVKIPEDQLITTLQRSGLAGVFLQVKGPDRKPDPRFGIVTMHGVSLDDLVKMAKSTKDVLGVVQLGQQQTFGLVPNVSTLQMSGNKCFHRELPSKRVRFHLTLSGGGSETFEHQQLAPI